MLTFDKPFTQQDSIPEHGIARAVEIMRTGRLHRYNVTADETAEASLLEREYAAYQGTKYCVATASGGQAIQLGLRVCGVRPGDNVLANAYTLAPVPGAIHNLGAEPVLIEITNDYHIDLNHLDEMARRSDAKVLLLSHMRGHIADMDALCKIIQTHKLKLVEDCAHTMGAKWRGIRSGNFGDVAAFSTQTYKHMNSGEGGFLTTNDDEMAARAIIHSGSYMLYERHGTPPPQEALDHVKLHTANYSCRMDNLRAALVRAQLPHLDANIVKWNKLYDKLYARLTAAEGIDIPPRRQAEFYVGSSIQFRTTRLSRETIPAFLAKCGKRGVELKWFGANAPTAFTSRYDSWAYLRDIPHLPATYAALDKTIDMRIPLTFDSDDCDIIASIIADEAASAA